MSEIIIQAEVRRERGKKTQHLRNNDNVPGVYYAHGQEKINITLPELTLKPLYKTSATHVINLKLGDGSSKMCILKDIAFDPVTDRPVHFDLLGLNENEEVVIEVPVQLTGGTPQGVKDGGILQHVMHKLRVSCLPKFIPDHIEVNVATLAMNKSVHVSGIAVPNVKLVDSPKNTVVAVVPPVVEKAPEVAAAEAAIAPIEPEVIAKGKKPEEGAEGTAPAAVPAAAKPAPTKKEEKK
ncbi:MAG: 50S ribosomal protein L25 [Ignavibacteriales bacterium]|nr:50S ribosomal protein L25 [Ignavibacteriales bacterium]